MSAGGALEASGEDRLIAQYFQPLARHPGALGLSDDAAVLAPPPGHELVLTVDALVAGVHFFADDAPAAVARKALRVNLSDLAAKGADPAGFLLALALPDGSVGPWLAGFCAGLAADAEAYRCPLLGGDTVSTPGPLTLSVTAFGTLPQGAMVHRAGARAGDTLFVTGTIGDAALGLHLRREAPAWGLSATERAHLLDRYLLPQPRNALAAAVREYASAAMDVSDGLAGDLAKLCRVSGVSAEVDVGAIPFSPAAQAALAADSAALDAALTGGDDYEILCAVAESRSAAFAAAAEAAGVPVAPIGRVVEGAQPPRFLRQGKALQFARGAFSHF